MKQSIKSGLAIASVTAVITLLSGCSASDVQTMVSGGEAISTSSVQRSPTSASSVKIYYASMNVPKHYQLLGHVSANNDNMIGIPHSQQTIADELRARAALLGANGVIKVNSGMEQTTGDAIFSKN